jgi:hypothetical protein
LEEDVLVAGRVHGLLLVFVFILAVLFFVLFFLFALLVII